MEKEKSLKQWLDALEAEGKEVKVTWEGGNDDGCYYAYVDDEEIDTDSNSYGTKLIDIVADEIGYGSFAGDFCTNGELIYEDGHMSGTNCYSENETDSLDISENRIAVKVPDYLWFDSISINDEGAYIGSSVSVDLIISNGPVVDEHLQVQDKIAEELQISLDDRTDKIEEEISYSYNEWVFNFDEGEVIDGMRTFYIDEIKYSYEKGEDKEIAIEITEDAEEQADDRREAERRRIEEWRNKYTNN